MTHWWARPTRQLIADFAVVGRPGRSRNAAQTRWTYVANHGAAVLGPPTRSDQHRRSQRGRLRPASRPPVHTLPIDAVTHRRGDVLPDRKATSHHGYESIPKSGWYAATDPQPTQQPPR